MPQAAKGVYSFPKGYMKGSETEIETARRVIFEETGLTPVYADGFRETDAYDLSEKLGTRQQAIYFPAEYTDETFILRQGEIC